MQTFQHLRRNSIRAILCNIFTKKYVFRFSQSDGTGANQVGTIKNEGSEDEYLAVSGSYTWVAPDGVTFKVTYIADKDGYKPEITVIQERPDAEIPPTVGGGAPPALIASLLG